MQTTHFRRWLVVAVAALFSTSAVAQQPGALGAGSGAYQQGVVYPGQPIQPTVGAAQAQPARTPAVGAPNLPPLPGAAVESTPVQRAVDDTMPKDAPASIRELRQRLDNFDKEAFRPARAAPIPKVRSIDLTQAPGETPPIIRLATGIPTTVAFIDSTGAPWPIAHVASGAPSQFDALVPQAGDSALYLIPKSDYAYGGAIIKLVDNPVPITIMVTGAQKEVDARVDAHIVTKRGPNAKAAVNGVAHAGTPPDPVLSSFLDGIPPNGAKVRKASIPGVSAWSFAGTLYVRTTAQLTSPNWYASKFSGDTRVYALPDVSAVTVSVDGEMTVVSLDE